MALTVAKGVWSIFTETFPELYSLVPIWVDELSLATFGLTLLASTAISFGSTISVQHHQKQISSIDDHENMTLKTAAQKPVITSAILLGLYISSKIIAKEYVTKLFAGYMYIQGLFAVHYLTKLLINWICSAEICNAPIQLSLNKVTEDGQKQDNFVRCKFTLNGFISFIIAFNLIYMALEVPTLNWIANNIIIFSLAIKYISIIHLNKVLTGCVMLGGILTHDMFWMYGKHFSASINPATLAFPINLLDMGLAANRFVTLGLGHICLPGSFVALMLRFDRSLQRSVNFYYCVSLVANAIGLWTANYIPLVMSTQHPTLLFIIPVGLGTPILLALLRGDACAMFNYQDYPEENRIHQE